MSYVTGCRLVVKLGTNEIYHRREQPPHPSTWRHVTKEPIVEGSLFWHRLREKGEREWRGWWTGCISEKHEIATITPRPRGESYLHWNASRRSVAETYHVERSTGCPDEREKLPRAACRAKMRERERDWPEDSASFRFFPLILFSVFVDVNVEEKWRDGRRMDRASSVIFVGREDIIAVLVSVKTYRVRDTDVGRVWLKVAFLFRFDFVFFLFFFFFRCRKLYRFNLKKFSTWIRFNFICVGFYTKIYLFLWNERWF